MKNTVSSLRRLVVLGALAALVPAAQAQLAPTSTPVGTRWDTVLSGAKQGGIAYLNFGEDGTVSGYELRTRIKFSSSASDNPRGLFADTGRATTVSGDTNTAADYVYGFLPVQGQWAYDYKGRLVGGYTMTVGDGTNDIVYAVNFTGKVVTGKRLTLVAYTQNGKMSYRGVPALEYGQLPDIRGNWYANKKMGSQYSNEIFPVTYDNPYPDDYPDLADYPGVFFSSGGFGAGYDFTGVTVLSSQKKIGFAFRSIPMNAAEDETGTVYATFGSFSTRKGGGYKASTVGVQDESQKISMQSYWQSPLPVIPEVLSPAN